MKVKILIQMNIKEEKQPPRVATPGEIVDLPRSQAIEMIGLGRAEEVIEEVVTDETKTGKTEDSKTGKTEEKKSEEKKAGKPDPKK